MSGARSPVLAAVAAFMLAACATQPARVPAPADRGQALRADAGRAAVVDWRLSGRVAISSGRQGGSGRLDWQQEGGRYALALSAPVTRQGWRLSGDAGRARLEGVEGGPREGDDVEDLLREATGWDIPVRAMVDWVRGIAAPRDRHGPARVEYGAGNLPASIEQAGWRIEYGAWYEAGAGQPAMPRRIEARRADARLRLVVDDWTLAAAPAGTPDDVPPADEALRRILSGLRLDDPAADARANAEAGDLRPVGVCGFACLAPGHAGDVVDAAGMRIIDHSGDVILGDHHLRLKHQAEAYARAYNAALAAWRAARADAGAADAD